MHEKTQASRTFFNGRECAYRQMVKRKDHETCTKTPLSISHRDNSQRCCDSGLLGRYRPNHRDQTTYYFINHVEKEPIAVIVWSDGALCYLGASNKMECQAICIKP
jgi:hypothetical protein